MKIFYNISQLATLESKTAKKGKAMNDLSIIKNGAFAIENGIFTAVGTSEELLALYPSAEKVDCNGKAVIPAFVDSHTHLVFGGYRQKEFNLRMNGASYMEIMQAGGGIAYTTEQTRKMSRQQLFDQAISHLEDMKAYGVATVEAKSGYGLDLDTELKQLEVINDLKKASGMNIVPTFMGAHATAKEFNGDSDKYIDFVIDTVLPEVKAQGIAEFCDIFTEKGVFDARQTEKLLNRARELGFKLKMHADEICNSESASLACKLGCTSADHLLHVSNDGIKAFANSNTIATLLPATAFSLREPYAPARKLIDGGAALAVASDFNPGSCFCNSIPLLIALATINMSMTVNEIISAMTINAAAAVDKLSTIGSIEVGKQADFLVLRWNDVEFLSYYIAGKNIDALYIKGEKA